MGVEFCFFYLSFSSSFLRFFCFPSSVEEFCDCFIFLLKTSISGARLSFQSFHLSSPYTSYCTVISGCRFAFPLLALFHACYKRGLWV